MGNRSRRRPPSSRGGGRPRAGARAGDPELGRSAPSRGARPPRAPSKRVPCGARAVVTEDDGSRPALDARFDGAAAGESATGRSRAPWAKSTSCPRRDLFSSLSDCRTLSRSADALTTELEAPGGAPRESNPRHSAFGSGDPGRYFAERDEPNANGRPKRFRARGRAPWVERPVETTGIRTRIFGTERRRPPVGRSPRKGGSLPARARRLPHDERGRVPPDAPRGGRAAAQRRLTDVRLTPEPFGAWRVRSCDEGSSIFSFG